MLRRMILLAFSLLCAVPAAADPRYWAGNGHYYDYIPGRMSWTSAEAAASVRMHMGVRGHLATITSQDENNFILDQFYSGKDSDFAWIGGQADNATSGTWRWVVGRETGTVFCIKPKNGVRRDVTYANWGGIEPNYNLGDAEKYSMFNIGRPFAGIAEGQWADAVDQPTSRDPVNGYIVEYDSFNQPPIANAGPDQTFECSFFSGKLVGLNGSASSDPNGDPLTYTWTGPFPEGGGVVQGKFQEVSLPPGTGTYTITLVVNDGRLNSAPDTVLITVRDTTAPEISFDCCFRNDGGNVWFCPPPASRSCFDGRFGIDEILRLDFSVRDLCDPAPRVTATLSFTGPLGPVTLPVAPNTLIMQRPFPPGDYLFIVTATDAAGNKAEKRSTFTFWSPQRAAGVVLRDLERLAESLLTVLGDDKSWPFRRLLKAAYTQVEDAIVAMNAGNDGQAIRELDVAMANLVAFRRLVSAQSGKPNGISEDLADELDDDADDLRSLLNQIITVLRR